MTECHFYMIVIFLPKIKKRHAEAPEIVVWFALHGQWQGRREQQEVCA
ncbi:MAG: hypothetical protein LBD52_04195 [Prevotellaceae bacterium]|jgi:hypothetical protein|nr:hypothetical protein [Prevotellaceae bacterium]